MKAEAQQIAIAEVLGFTEVGYNTGHSHDEADYIGKVPNSEEWEDVPDYLHDLNACAAMEEWMETNHPNLCLEYSIELKFVIAPDRPRGVVGDFRFVRATAPQRCEAFLKILGLWKEEIHDERLARGGEEPKKG